MKGEKRSLGCRLRAKAPLGGGLVRLDFEWPFAPPRAGQFFMVKPARTSVFLARPLSAAACGEESVAFLAAVRGKGTAELAAMPPGEEALLTGPLGKGWAAFLPQNAVKPVMLISGGLGIAPLAAFGAELRHTSVSFDLLAGFVRGADGENILSALGIGMDEAIIVSEDGGLQNAKRGLVTRFLDAQKYSAVFACGPPAMLRSAALLCREAGTPCFVSLETRMACGTGACLGCAVPARDGTYRHCCTDGPVFDAEDVFFDE
ncbi:MAG: dihydroorotate dehydrogenase electron transfer subunit [Spirochaetaceae bacterium]|jgi:NAD(P)H-flavin reductase|nr:dihydroorotate dehydrogenase electron transfer subunit [Spirochaetaceae bacterium]